MFPLKTHPNVRHQSASVDPQYLCLWLPLECFRRSSDRDGDRRDEDDEEVVFSARRSRRSSWCASERSAERSADEPCRRFVDREPRDRDRERCLDRERERFERLWLLRFDLCVWLLRADDRLALSSMSHNPAAAVAAPTVTAAAAVLSDLLLSYFS